jgi:hypothetical protein
MMKPKLCTAAHENGYACERDPGHDGDHRGGDFTWQGTTRWRETQNVVLSLLMDRIMSTREIADATGLHIRTVQRHVNLLASDALAERVGDKWAA